MVAGCDLGKATAKLVLLSLAHDGDATIVRTETVAHGGQPMQAFRDWYARASVAECAALGATGLHADEFVAPVVHGLPEHACLEAALPHLLPTAGALNVVSVGARGYSVLDVIDTVRRIAGVDFKVVDAPRRAGDPPELIADSTKLRSALGWVPALDNLDTIVTQALAWERKLQSAQKDS